MAEVVLVNANEIDNELQIAGWMGSASTDSSLDCRTIAEKCIESGHLSVTRPMRFLFEISELSRAAANQLIRHEQGIAKCQESQRYVNLEFNGYVTPESIAKSNVEIEIADGNTINKWDYHSIQWLLKQYYKMALAQGIPMEDARYILSAAEHTKVNMSMNWEALVHLCNLRFCERTQWELRELARMIRFEVLKANIYLGDKLMCKCDEVGFCVEERSCGRRGRKQND